MRTPTVTVVGCVQADVVMSPVSDLPTAGGTLLTEQMTVRVGGAGANAALASVEAGMDTRLIGCIGDDHLGIEKRLPAQQPMQETTMTIGPVEHRRDGEDWSLRGQGFFVEIQFGTAGLGF